MRFLVLSLLAACAIPEPEFTEQLSSDLCAYASECTTGDTDPPDPAEATCEEAVMATANALADDETCTYDPVKAQSCLDAIEAGSCDDPDAIGSACAGVWSGDACNLTLTDYL